METLYSGADPNSLSAKASVKISQARLCRLRVKLDFFAITGLHVEA